MSNHNNDYKETLKKLSELSKDLKNRMPSYEIPKVDTLTISNQLSSLSEIYKAYNIDNELNLDTSDNWLIDILDKQLMETKQLNETVLNLNNRIKDIEAESLLKEKRVFRSNLLSAIVGSVLGSFFTFLFTLLFL